MDRVQQRIILLLRAKFCMYTVRDVALYTGVSLSSVFRSVRIKKSQIHFQKQCVLGMEASNRAGTYL